jgi:hypothetical protein
MAWPIGALCQPPQGYTIAAQPFGVLAVSHSQRRIRPGHSIEVNVAKHFVDEFSVPRIATDTSMRPDLVPIPNLPPVII